MLKVLFMSTPVGPLGSGLGGGVELTVYNMAMALQQRGYSIRVVAPAGSVLSDLNLMTIPGQEQMFAQIQGREVPISLPPDSVLANMWDYARKVQQDYDLVVNFAYDWLPFYLTPFFDRPIAHLVSMASISSGMDQIIEKTYHQFPNYLGFHSRGQAETFNIGDRYHVLKNGFDLSLYQFCETPSEHLAWVGRISPEKALEDALSACKMTGMPLRIFGKVQDPEYWERICQEFKGTHFEYCGFLPTVELQGHLRTCKGLIMTPRWVEAFGNVATEALACGVPVISYRRGGPAEILREGESGFLVDPDDVMGLAAAMKRLDEINRYKCRQQAEQEYSLEAFGDRCEGWFRDIALRASSSLRCGAIAQKSRIQKSKV